MKSLYRYIGLILLITTVYADYKHEKLVLDYRNRRVPGLSIGPRGRTSPELLSFIMGERVNISNVPFTVHEKMRILMDDMEVLSRVVTAKMTSGEVPDDLHLLFVQITVWLQNSINLFETYMSYWDDVRTRDFSNNCKVRLLHWIGEQNAMAQIYLIFAKMLFSPPNSALLSEVWASGMSKTPEIHSQYNWSYVWNTKTPLLPECYHSNADVRSLWRKFLNSYMPSSWVSSSTNQMAVFTPEELSAWSYFELDWSIPSEVPSTAKKIELWLGTLFYRYHYWRRLVPKDDNRETILKDARRWIKDGFSFNDEPSDDSLKKLYAECYITDPFSSSGHQTYHKEAWRTMERYYKGDGKTSRFTTLVLEHTKTRGGENAPRLSEENMKKIYDMHTEYYRRANKLY